MSGGIFLQGGDVEKKRPKDTIIAVSGCDAELYPTINAVEDALNTSIPGLHCSGVFARSAVLSSEEVLSWNYRDHVQGAAALVLVVGKGIPYPMIDDPEGIPDAEFQMLDYFYKRAQQENIPIIPCLWLGQHENPNGDFSDAMSQFASFRAHLEEAHDCIEFNETEDLMIPLNRRVLNVLEARTYQYDVAISYSRRDSSVVDLLVPKLEAGGLRVFFDRGHIYDSWGKVLPEYLSEVFERRSQFVLIIGSSNYVRSKWASYELECSLRRSSGSPEHILVLRLDNTTIPMLPANLVYMDWSDSDRIARVLSDKIRLKR